MWRRSAWLRLEDSRRLILPDEKPNAESLRSFRLASDMIQCAGIELGFFEEGFALWLHDFGLV